MPRADDRVDDRPMLAELGEIDPNYVANAAAGWAADTRYVWAVCEPTTGELLAEVALNPASGEISTRQRSGHEQAALTGAQAVSRFAAGALGLTAVVVDVGGAVSSDQYPGHTAERQH